VVGGGGVGGEGVARKRQIFRIGVTQDGQLIAEKNG
jgi:hypothetical protein